MESSTDSLRQTTAAPHKAGPPRMNAARKRFDPTQLFAQRDRLPWFWFFVAVAVTVLAAFDRYHLVQQFKHRERVVIVDPSQTYYISPLLQFQEAKDLHAQQAELAAMAFLSRNPKEFDHLDLLKQVFLKAALAKAQDQHSREAVEFRSKQLHQKPEIARIDILATRENEVLATVSGQVIRTGVFQEKAFTEAFNFKLSLRLIRDPNMASNGRFPTAVGDKSQITDFGDYEIRIEEMFRFNPEDTVVFHLTLRNKSDQEIRYRSDSFAVRAGNRLYHQSISDAPGVLPPKAASTVYVAITGTPDGGRNELSLKNEFSVLVTRVTPQPALPELSTGALDWIETLQNEPKP